MAPSTVSYVISGKRSISPKTRRLVEESIRKLGYHPHAGARALASSKTNVLALVVPLRTDLNVAVVMQFVASAVTAARAHDHDLLLLTKDEGPAALQRVASSAIADALMVMDVEAADPRVPMLHRARPAGGAHRRARPPRRAELRRPGLHRGGLGVPSRTWPTSATARIALIGPSPAVYRRGTSYATRFLRRLRRSRAAA